LLGLRPTTTGIYGLKPWFRTVPEWSDRVTLPQHFANDGYYTAATGKIYHGFRKNPKKKNQGTSKPDPVEFEVTGPFGGVGTKPPKKLIPETPMGNHPLMDWGVWPLDNDDTQKGDYQVASWTVEQIQNAPKDRPFFLAAGFFLPHVPCYATQKWFDLYPDDDSVLPPILKDDRADTPRFSWYIHCLFRNQDSSGSVKTMSGGILYGHILRVQVLLMHKLVVLCLRWNRASSRTTPSSLSGEITDGILVKKI
jgi:arylsulfatase A-like enzyme